MASSHFKSSPHNKRPSPSRRFGPSGRSPRPPRSGRRRLISISYAGTRKKATWIVVAAAAALTALLIGVYGYRYMPVSNSVKVQWGVHFAEPSKPPEAPPKGVELLQKYQGLYIADTNKKTVYFTYDLGYEAGYTSGVLDVLRDKGVHAIFFICGHYSDKEETLVRRMMAEGHTIGNHTAKHKNPTQLSLAQVQKDMIDLQQPFTEKYGAKMQFYRPPGGEFNEETLMVAQEIGLIPVLWSLAYNDWQRDKTVGKKVVLDTVMGRMHSGAIMLFHITSADVPAALPDIIDTLRSQGYTIGEPQDLLDLAGKTPAQ